MKDYHPDLGDPESVFIELMLAGQQVDKSKPYSSGKETQINNVNFILNKIAKLNGEYKILVFENMVQIKVGNKVYVAGNLLGAIRQMEDESKTK